MTPPALWDRYVWRGHEVVVIQQWTDPFGRPMIRVADPDDEDRAEGVSLAEFLMDAERCPDLSPDPQPGQRRPGALKGAIGMTSDFDSLPPDVLAAMEGEGP